jgi:hypothetical protein
LVTNPINGLLVSADCRPLADKLRFTYNMFCVNFMGEIVKLCVCTLLLLALMFGGMIAGSIFGVRYA